jgi:hypothetical protein
MTEYTVTASEMVNSPAAELIPWLATPALMARWIVGAQSVEALDDRGIAVGAATRLVIRISHYGQAYSGEIIELSPARLVRRYHLETMKAGVLRLPARPSTSES